MDSPCFEVPFKVNFEIYHNTDAILLHDKIFHIFIHAQTGNKQVCTLEAPAKVLNMHGQEM